MADKTASPSGIIELGTIQEFFAQVKNLDIRLVKVADQGIVEPARRGTAMVMQPMVRVVATALDYDNNKILRWADKWDVGSGAVSLNGTDGHRRHGDPTGTRTRDSIVLEAQKRGLQVVRGEEWTPKDLNNALAGIGRRGE